MSTEEKKSPYPKELDEKFARIGWDAWDPTPGITDEGKEVYLTLHLHAMSAAEALSLTDEEFRQRMWAIALDPFEALIRYQQRAGLIEK